MRLSHVGTGQNIFSGSISWTRPQHLCRRTSKFTQVLVGEHLSRRRPEVRQRKCIPQETTFQTDPRNKRARSHIGEQQLQQQQPSMWGYRSCCGRPPRACKSLKSQMPGEIASLFCNGYPRVPRHPYTPSVLYTLLRPDGQAPQLAPASLRTPLAGMAWVCPGGIAQGPPCRGESPVGSPKLIRQHSRMGALWHRISDGLLKG